MLEIRETLVSRSYSVYCSKSMLKLRETCSKNSTIFESDTRWPKVFRAIVRPFVPMSTSSWSKACWLSIHSVPSIKLSPMYILISVRVI